MKERCPHCRSDADVESAGALGYRCMLCGGPRVVVTDETVERSEREVPLLVRAQSLRLRRAAWGATGGAIGLLGSLSFLVVLAVLAVATPGLLPTVLTLVAAAVPLVVAAVAWRRFAQLGAQMHEAVDEALRFVTDDIVQSHDGEVTAEELAEVLQTTPERAQQLLGRLAVDDVLRQRVTDSGDLGYTSRQRVRVEDDAESEPIAEAEEEEQRRVRTKVSRS